MAAAVLLGAAAVLAFGLASGDWVRLLIAVAVLAVGLGFVRATGGRLGRPVLVGIGVSAVVVGAHLMGLALVAMWAPDAPAVGILLGYGLPALALLGLAVRGMVAAAVGLGVIVSVVALALLAGARNPAGPTAIALLVVALAGIAVASWTTSHWATAVTIVGATAAAAAIQAATAMMGSSTGELFGTGFVFSSRGFAWVGAEGAPGDLLELEPGAMLAVITAALAAAAVLLVLAVLRRDVAAGIVAATVFAVPPTTLTFWIALGGTELRPSRLGVVAIAAVPIAAALLALLALGSARLRTGLVAVTPRRVRPPTIPAPVLVATVAVTAVVLAVQAVPVTGWPPRVQGVVALVVLVLAGVVALRLAGTPGAVVAGVTLVGLQLAAPWPRMVDSGPLGYPGGLGLPIAVVGLLVAGTAAWALARRHRHPGVLAAAAYLLAGSIASLLWTLLSTRDTPARYADYQPVGELATALVLIGPVLLLGVPAAVAALRGREQTTIAGGQAAGAVLLAVGGAALLSIGFDRNDGVLAQLAGSPLLPTAAPVTFQTIEEPGGATLLAVEALLALTLALVLSVARRPSAALAAAAVLAGLAGMRTALRASESSGVDSLMWILVAVGAVLAVAAATRATSVRGGE